MTKQGKFIKDEQQKEQEKKEMEELEEQFILSFDSQDDEKPREEAKFLNLAEFSETIGTCEGEAIKMDGPFGSYHLFPFRDDEGKKVLISSASSRFFLLWEKNLHKIIGKRIKINSYGEGMQKQFTIKVFK